MKLTVCFTKYYNYEIEVPDYSEESKDKAFFEAYDEFRTAMCSPIADTSWDDVEFFEEG